MELTKEEIVSWLSAKFADNFQVDISLIDIRRDFADYGLDSLTAVGLVGEIEDWLGHDLPVMILWDYSNICDLSDYLKNENSPKS